MEDYIDHIDFNAIRLADLALEIGDHKCAHDNYSKALKRLRYYQGDRMQPLVMAQDLLAKIKALRDKLDENKALLYFDTWKLTKSSYVKGMQCLKYLYLDKYKKFERSPISKEKKELFDKGHSFEEAVRSELFPDGINVKERVGNFAYFNSFTGYLLAQPGKKVVYEATIIEEDVLVMCDILVRDEDGRVDVYEIKMTEGVNEAILNDLMLQYVVCRKRFKESLNSFNLILRSNDTDKGWRVEDHSEFAMSKYDHVIGRIKDHIRLLEGDEPIVRMGEHCEQPYECDFKQYCKSRC